MRARFQVNLALVKLSTQVIMMMSWIMLRMLNVIVGMNLRTFH